MGYINQMYFKRKKHPDETTEVYFTLAIRSKEDIDEYWAATKVAN